MIIFSIRLLRLATFPDQVLFYTQEETCPRVPVKHAIFLCSAVSLGDTDYRGPAQDKAMVSCTSHQLFQKRRGIQIDS